MLVLTLQVTFKTHIEPPEAMLQLDLENNFLCLILSGDCDGLQQYMWFCRLQSGLHVQHKNKVLISGLSVQRITTKLEICLHRLQNHCVGSQSFMVLSCHIKVTTQNLVALAVWVSIQKALGSCALIRACVAKTVINIIQLIGHCIPTWYAMSRSLVKLTEIGTSWGGGGAGHTRQ